VTALEEQLAAAKTEADSAQSKLLTAHDTVAAEAAQLKATIAAITTERDDSAKRTTELESSITALEAKLAAATAGAEL
jgi:peptidoglycan hydrolase CwlO-like protein